MSVRCIQNSGEYRVSGAVDRVPSSERRDTVSSLRRITRIAPFSTLSKPDSGLILSLAEPPIGASRSSQRCALRVEIEWSFVDARTIIGSIRFFPAPPHTTYVPRLSGEDEAGFARWRTAQSYGLPPAPQSRRVFYVGSTPGREIIRECCSGARSQAPTFTFRRRSVAAGLWAIGAQLQHENDVGAGSMPSAIDRHR